MSAYIWGELTHLRFVGWTAKYVFPNKGSKRVRIIAGNIKKFTKKKATIPQKHFESLQRLIEFSAVNTRYIVGFEVTTWSNGLPYSMVKWSTSKVIQIHPNASKFIESHELCLSLSHYIPHSGEMSMFQRSTLWFPVKNPENWSEKWGRVWGPDNFKNQVTPPRSESYPLENIQSLLLKIAIYSWFTH